MKSKSNKTGALKHELLVVAAASVLEASADNPSIRQL
jgi:hypothetical protein